MEKMSTEIKADVSAILAGGAITQAQICREMQGVSTGALSAFLKGTYTGDNDAVAQKLEKWLSRYHRENEIAEKQAQLILDIPFQRTPTANKLWATLEYAQIGRDFVCIVGGAGVGKTELAKAYATGNPNVWNVEYMADCAAVTTALEEIALSIGIRDVSGKVRLRRAIVGALRDSKGLLIIDEAQHLSFKTLEEIRGLHDAAGVGVAVMGNESVLAKMSGAGNRSVAPQIYSRIGKYLRITKPQKADVEIIAREYGLLEKKAIDFAYQLSTKPGGLRGMVKCIRRAALAALGDGSQSVTAEHLRAAWAEWSGVIGG